MTIFNRIKLCNLNFKLFMSIYFILIPKRNIKTLITVIYDFERINNNSCSPGKLNENLYMIYTFSLIKINTTKKVRIGGVGNL